MALEDVLVIDDDESILMMLKEYLEGECGLSVVTASRAMEGLTKLVEKKFALVISDITMPGMTGLEMIMRVRGTYPDIKIIMMSSESSSANIVKAMKNGADDFVPKPFDLEEMGSCVKKLVQQNKKRDTAKDIKLLFDSFGDYQIEKQLGSGGMGIVFRAKQVSTGATVALKILYPSLLQSEDMYQRFLREAKVMGELNHSNIVKAFDVGKTEGNCFIAMEYIDGGNLGEVIDGIEHYGIKDALPLMGQMFEALKYMHSKNIIHRDIKPGNIMVTKDNSVKIADMGLSKNTGGDMDLTQPGVTLGTAGYMPPEAIFEKDPLDIRGDIYSLGGVFYFMFIGKHPFEGKNAQIFLRQREYVPRVSEIRVNFPKELDDFIYKMMQPEKENRFQNPEEMIMEFYSLNY